MSINMLTASTATAKIFMTALKSMPRKEQSSILIALVEDNNFREDIIDLAVAVKRSREKTHPFRAFLKDLQKFPKYK